MNKELNISYEILSRVFIDKSYVSIELNKHIGKLSNVNYSTITKIVYGVLEKDISLEYFISQFVKKMPETKLLILLKIVAYVSKNLNSIPSFALVNEIVTIAKKINPHQSGFINATSKNLISKQLILPDKKNTTKYLSVKYNFPEWVIKELLKTKSLKFVEELVSTELTTHTHIRILTDKISPKDFKNKLKELDINFEDSYYDYTIYVDYSKLLKTTDLSKYYIVQGLPSIVTCNVLGAKSGEVLDVCASPGGKSVLIAQSGDVSVYSCDIHAHRVELIKKYAKTYEVNNIKYFVQDGTVFREDWKEKFDYVLCDVPCSNLGVSRKKPDVFLNKSMADVSTLAGIQYKILCNSARYVKSGGVLQYSTCTILDNENKDVIMRFLKENKDFELTSINVDGLNVYDDNNLYTFYPNLTKTEGFFIGRLKRK